MSHLLQGFVFQARQSGKLSRFSWGSKAVPLSQGFEMMIEPEYDPDLGAMLPSRIGEFASDCSRVTPIAFVETEYIGFEGRQSAGAWQDGRAVVPFSVGGIGTINRSLAAIGCRRSPKIDEFEAIGLHWYRTHEHWIEFAGHGRAHWQTEPWPDAYSSWLDWKANRN